MGNKIINFLLTAWGLLLMGWLVLLEAIKWGLSFFYIPKPKPVTARYYVRVLWRNFALSCFFVWFYFLAVDINLFWLFGKSPSLADLEKPKLSIASEVYSADGVLLGKYYRENRVPTAYNSISPHVVKALIATEDNTFTEHTGIDLKAMISIGWYLLKGDNRGGSTITQQLAKNLYKTRKKKGFGGPLTWIPGVKILIDKTKEWITATKLERNYTKEEIMSMYLNTVDFGSNSYGIRTASQTFFKTTPGRLKIEEAAVLIGMLKATTTYNPKRNYNKSLKRRNTVLANMAKMDFISARQLDSLSALPIRLNYTQEPHPDGVLDYYGAYLTKQLVSWADSNEFDIYSDGLKIYLSIDTRFQKHAREAVNEHMKALQRRFDGHWRGQNPWIDEHGHEIPGFIDNMVLRTEAYKGLKKKFGDNKDSISYYLNRPKKMVLFSWNGPDSVTMSTIDSLTYCKRLLHSGFVVMDPFRGEVKAWIGGIDYQFFQYDHVEQSVRQPGSTFKAFVYGAAMENGYNPCSRIQDRYVKYEYDEDSAGVMVHKTWAPSNATGYFTGSNMTLRFAMGRSINSVAAQLTDLLGAQKVADFAQKCGITTPLKPIPSIGLGSNDVSLFDMVNAYSVFLNNGMGHERPLLVTRIEDHNSNLVRTFTSKIQKVMSEQAAYNMVHMLKGTLQEPGGTAQALFTYNIFRGNEMGGKTGTSSNQSDGWFMGLTKDLVGGVWVGAEERAVHFRTLRTGEGSKTALPIFGIFMEKVYGDKSLGIRPSFFPRKNFKLPHCPTYIPKKDTASADSLAPTEPDPTELELE